MGLAGRGQILDVTTFVYKYSHKYYLRLFQSKQKCCIGLTRNRLIIQRLTLRGYLQSFHSCLFSPTRDSLLKKFHFDSSHQRVL